ncbi:hypothetical protein J41TS12_50450 [Paenibacillus antibioticophila]|uniref:Uncharacterized protein n=1 Tax=Paenibacillus antibioticophila TaxID=1274374 RepID=A0A919XY43_9BACL|nr:hypothetical protein [Paenibacillus antibioticophila]GIO40184.1 hypothetical protein J41TS12_50450 [Paenibacillus antibioticophila]
MDGMTDLDRFSRPLWGEQERRNPQQDEIASYKQERDSGLAEDSKEPEGSDAKICAIDIQASVTDAGKR